MKPQNILSVLGTLPSLVTPHLSLFSFGDSYTTTGFNASSAQPSLQNPMGNPRLGDGTSADSINWVGYLTTLYNDTPVLSYNHAVYGATIDNEIVSNVPHDLVYQISQSFRPHYCHASSESESEPGAHWSSDAALFTIWIGINDIHFIYLRPDYAQYIDFVLHRYLTLLDTLHHCRARDFLVINIPPIHRTPKILLLAPWQQRIYAAAIERYNHQLRPEIYDAWTFTSEVLDHSQEFGFVDSTCMGEGCIWFDHLHPRSAFHRILAADLAVFLRGG
ncbi:hypothetical protein BDV12DRAFT_211353 [Aspergillus spectabilis]